MKIKEEQGFIPKYALRKYTSEQLLAHLRSNKHSRKQLIEVAITAALLCFEGGAKKVEAISS